MKNNKIIKNLVMIFIMIASLFTFVACKDPDDEKPETISQEEAFQKFKIAQANLNDPTKGYKETTTAKMSMITETVTTTAVSTVNFQTGELAVISKDSDGNIVSEQYVVNSDEKTIFYQHEADYSSSEVEHEYNAMYVGKDFIYNYNGENGTMINTVSIDDADTFEEFKAEFTEMYTDTMEEDMNVGDDAAVSVSKFEFSKDGDAYKFEMTLSFSSQVGSFTMKMTIKFSDTYINSMTMDVSSFLTSIKTTSNFSPGYDSTLIPSSFDNYPNSNEIENAEFMVTYYMDGVTSGWLNTYYDSYKPGETFAFNEEYLEDIAIENTTIDGWYLDPKYTQKIDTLTEYPSYDIELYAKTVPNEGYAVVVYTANIKEEGNLFWFPNSETIAYSVTDSPTIDLSHFVTEPDATITDITVNGTVLNGTTTLELTNKGYYIVIINGTTPETDLEID